MATKSNKQQERDRRARVEAMREAEKARERRRSMLFVGVAAVLGLGLIAAAAVPAYVNSKNDPANKDLSEFGVSASAASCDPVTTDATTGGNDHQDGVKLEYEQVPPSSGAHWSQAAFPARAFYTERDRPEVEQLVHNLEHGYTVLWYDDTVKGKQLDLLRDISESARGNKATRGKFIVSAWDDADGAFPEGKNIALSHWGAKQGYRQLCGGISGAVVKRFVEKYPSLDSPEPNAG